MSEPDWLDDDRAWAIALLSLEADACSGCGQPMSESTQPEAEGGYDVPDPTRCHSCTAKHIHEQRYTESPPGLFFETHRRR